MSEFPPAPAPADPPTEPASPTGGSVQLSGWRLWGAWALLAGIAAWGAAANIAAFPLFWDNQVRAETDFQALHVNARWERGVPVTPQRGGVADLAGMPSGRLVAVEGQPVAEGASIIDAAELVRAVPGDSVRLSVATLESDTVTVAIGRTDTPAPEFAEAGLTYFAFAAIRNGLGFFVSFIGLVTAVLLLLRRPRSTVALVAAAVFLMLAAVTPLADTVVDALQTLRFFGLDTFGNLSFVAFLLFLALFPDGRLWPRWTWVLPVAALVRVVVFQLLPLDPRAMGGGWALFEFVSFIALAALGVGAHVYRYRVHATEDQRLQTKWATLGITAGLSIGISSIFFFLLTSAEAGSGWWWWRSLIGEALQLGFALMPLGVLLSLLRYRLWDAEAAWSRSAMAAALTLVLTAVVAGGTAFAQTALGAGGPLSLAMATGAAALLFVPLQKRLSDWADHRFLRDLTDLKEKLPELVSHLRETESVEGIAEAVTDRVLPAVHATHVALAVPMDEGWRTVGTEGIGPASVDVWGESAGLSDPPDLAGTRRQPWRDRVWREPGDRQFPVRVALRAERGGGEIATEGWLLLGPRPDGSGYGPDDLEAVAQIAGPVGRALQVVRVRDAREAARSDRADALAESLRQLRDAVAALHAARASPPAPH